MTGEPEEDDQPPLFQATITGYPEAFATCDELDLDLLPTRRPLGDGRTAIQAVVRLDQLVPLVAAGVTVQLERLIDTHLPASRILSSDQARSRRGLDRFRGQSGV